MQCQQLFGLQQLMGKQIKIGTRGSKLALWQANWVKSALTAGSSSVSVDIEVIKTKGDKILDVPLAKIGGKGLFVKEIEDALLNRRIDLAVHSMKDMPAELPEGLIIGAIPERENPQDVLLSKTGCTFSELKKGACIGTSSLRRGAQLRAERPDIEIVPLRGNLDTRVRKLQTQDLDAIVLAAAGVKRLAYERFISEFLDPDIMLPAAGQGALCIETRQDDPLTADIISAIDHADTRSAVLGERAFLCSLEGGCQVPIAALGRIEGDQLVLTGLVADIDGQHIIKDCLKGPKTRSERMGQDLAAQLRSRGAGEILKALQET
jgi:hydroxymethylbilane synthase